MRRVVGRQVVAKSVALVDGAPERAGSGLNRKARTIANAGRVDALMFAVGIEGEHVGAALLVAERGAERRFGNVGLIRRGTPSSTLLPEPTETNNVLSSGEKARSRVQCPPPLGRLAIFSAGPRGFHRLRCDRESARRSPASRHRQTSDLVLKGRRRSRMAAASLRRRSRPCAGPAPAFACSKDAHPPGAGFGNEDIAVRRDANDARHIEPAGEKSRPRSPAAPWERRSRSALRAATCSPSSASHKAPAGRPA